MSISFSLKSDGRSPHVTIDNASRKSYAAFFFPSPSDEDRCVLFDKQASVEAARWESDLNRTISVLDESDDGSGEDDKIDDDDDDDDDGDDDDGDDERGNDDAISWARVYDSMAEA